MWSKIAALVLPTSRNRASNTSPDEASCANQAQSDELVSEEAIRLRAYQKWEAAGKPEGDDLRFWLEAKREAQRSRRPKPR